MQMDDVSVGGAAYEEADVVHEFYVTRLGEVFCFEMWNVSVVNPDRGSRKNEHITPNSRQELELHLAKAEGLEIFSEAAVDAAAEATAVESVIYVRVPASLKLRVEAAAEKAKLSCKHTLYGALSCASEKPMLKRSFARWPYSNEPRVAQI